MRWFLPLMFLSACGPAATTYRVDWSFANLQEGYDHQNRLDVYVDGNKVAESTVKAESEPNTVAFDLAEGTHHVKLVNLALYEGNWEEHTVENNYSIDCIWEGDVKGGGSLKLQFDIDNGVVVLKER